MRRGLQAPRRRDQPRRAGVESRSLMPMAAYAGGFLALDEIPRERRSIETLVLLGRVNDASFFAYEIDSLERRT